MMAMIHLHHRKARLDQAILDKQVRLPQVKSLRWRVDVAISTRCTPNYFV